MTQAILDAVDAGFAAQTEFLSRLVEIPSTRGAEAPAQDMIAAALRARGYTVDHWRIDPEDLKHLPGFSPVDVSYDRAYSVVGALRCPNPTGRSLIIQGHCDVVPEGPHAMWTTPPYRPTIRDGWMYGRGAGDMKAGLTAMIFALDALRAAGHAPGADVFLQSVIEEECTGNGALSTLQRGYRADAVLIPESTQHRLARAQVGVLWFKVRVGGRPVHVADTASGSNAIEAAFAIAQALKALEADWNVRAREDAHFGTHPHPINLNIGKIQGGDWASSVPAWCEIDFRIAILASWDIAASQAEITACIRRAALAHPFLSNSPPDLAWNGFLADGYVLEGGEDAVAVLARAHTSVVGGPLEESRLTSLTDTRLYGRYYGIPSLCYGGIAEDYHGFNERVHLDSLRKTTGVLALFVAEWCGLLPSPLPLRERPAEG